MDNFELAADYLLTRFKRTADVGIICGSGLSGLSKNFTDQLSVKYSEIPGFPKIGVAGHKDELVFGNLGDTKCVCFRGRFHYYEGNTMEKVVLGVRVMRLLGVKLVVVTNAAGGLNPQFKVGDIMIITDHFALPCLAGIHPLVGPNYDSLGDRFIPISNTYDPEIVKITNQIASEMGISQKIRPSGTYCFVSGPTYESSAEANFLRSIGGDSVGMSTIPEIIAAKHCEMKVLGLSLITNSVVKGDHTDTHASHEEVLGAVLASGDIMETLVKKVVNSQSMRQFLNTVKLPTPDDYLQIRLKKKNSTVFNTNTIVICSAILLISGIVIYKYKA